MDEERVKGLKRGAYPCVAEEEQRGPSEASC